MEGTEEAATPYISDDDLDAGRMYVSARLLVASIRKKVANQILDELTESIDIIAEKYGVTITDTVTEVTRPSLRHIDVSANFWVQGVSEVTFDAVQEMNEFVYDIVTTAGNRVIRGNFYSQGNATFSLIPADVRRIFEDLIGFDPNDIEVVPLANEDRSDASSSDEQAVAPEHPKR